MSNSKKRLIKDIRCLDRLIIQVSKISNKAYKEYDYQLYLQGFGGMDTQIRDNSLVIHDACAEAIAAFNMAIKKLC